MTHKTFIFETHNFNKQKKQLTCKYSFDSKIFFEETFTFDFEFTKNYNQQSLKNACFGLFTMAGISYFKAALPQKIIFKTSGLNQKQTNFFQKTYQNGLGEFFYTNNINPKNKINFPQPIPQSPTLQNQKPEIQNQKTLVPIGGGKDSIVTAEILKQAQIPFETWTVGTNQLLEKCCKHIGATHLKIQRKISPTLIELNKKGALNGHIPISAILAFLSTITAILRDQTNIAFSNEHSANEENLIFKNHKINHQYSKTLEFEKDFQTYTKNFIDPNINYFSFLRPLSELKIAQIFCQNFYEKYKNIFSSCNRNFHINKKQEKIIWCGKCPKCAFVFAIFSPFLEKEKLIKLFNNQNLFLNKELKQTFQELTGQSSHKPLECVGEIEEVKAAIKLAQETNNFPELKNFKFPPQNFNPEKTHPHQMPKHFEKTLLSFIMPSSQSCHSREGGNPVIKT